MTHKAGLSFFMLLCVALIVLDGSSAMAGSGTTMASPTQEEYRLGTGDKLHISVFGQTELNGDYIVDATGNLQLPLVGEVHAAGLSVAELQKVLTAKLADGYFVNPSVNVDVVNYRPFYIIGQVNKPGEYDYVSGMSVLNAVALAGGYTPRADESEAYIRRNGATKEAQVPADETTKVMPGDIIRIPERYF